ncbi:hypothetical protein [Nocardioides nanhaiensis]
MREIWDFAPRTPEDDWAVDIGFFTGDDTGDDSPPMGVSAGAVGRSQRRFVVWHRLPKGMGDAGQVREWFAEHLLATERLVREYLPTKSCQYPAEHLADQVRDLRDHLRSRA